MSETAIFFYLKQNKTIMENATENKTWVVYSNDNNDGRGEWDYHYPKHETEDDLDFWFNQNRYNSMVECKQFNSKESALEYYNSMNR